MIYQGGPSHLIHTVDPASSSFTETHSFAMHAHSTYFPILSAVALLPQLSVATWSPNKAAEINAYLDTLCTQYNGEEDAWWVGLPLVGSSGSTTAPTHADCIGLNMPGDSQGINTAALWLNTSTAEIGQGYCTFWDDVNCSGNQVSSTPGDGVCQPARSQGGSFWKSAKCVIHYRQCQCCR